MMTATNTHDTAELQQCGAEFNPLLTAFADTLRQRPDVKQTMVAPLIPPTDDLEGQLLTFGLSAEKVDGHSAEWWFKVKRQTTQWLLEYGVSKGEPGAEGRQAIIWFPDKVATTADSLTEALKAAHQDLKATEQDEQVLGYINKRRSDPSSIEASLSAEQAAQAQRDPRLRAIRRIGLFMFIALLYFIVTRIGARVIPETVGVWLNGLVPFCGGVCMLLIAHRLVGKQLGEDARYDAWHFKNAGRLKVLGPLMILFSLFTIGQG